MIAEMTPSGARLIVASIAFFCALFLAASPRAVVPLEPPYPIVKASPDEANDGAKDGARDGLRLAEGADPAVNQLLQLLLERGAAEIGVIEPSDRFAERDARIRLLARSLESQLGEEAMRAFSRQIAREIERGIVQGANHNEAVDPRLIARLDRQLELHHASLGGALIAPPSLVRAFALARLAMVFGEPRVDRFMSPSEREIYYGWAALFGEGEVQRFGEEGYAAIRPEIMRRATAFRAFHAGDFDAAALLYRRIYEEEGSIAARNYALAATSLARSGG